MNKTYFGTLDSSATLVEQEVIRVEGLLGGRLVGKKGIGWHIRESIIRERSSFRRQERS